MSEGGDTQAFYVIWNSITESEEVNLNTFLHPINTFSSHTLPATLQQLVLLIPISVAHTAHALVKSFSCLSALGSIGDEQTIHSLTCRHLGFLRTFTRVARSIGLGSRKRRQFISEMAETTTRRHLSQFPLLIGLMCKILDQIPAQI